MDSPVSWFFRSFQGKLVHTLWLIIGISSTYSIIANRRKALEMKKAKEKQDSVDNALTSKTLSPPQEQQENHLKNVMRIVLGDGNQGGKGKRMVIFSAIQLSVSVLARLFVSIVVSQKIGRMGSLLAQRDWVRFVDEQISFALWTFPQAVLNAYCTTAENMLAMSIRSQIVSEIHSKYNAEVGGNKKPLLLADAFQGSDASSFAVEEVTKMSQQLAILYHNTFKPVAESIIISATLARIMGLRELLMTYAYFGVVGSWSRLVTPSFMTQTKTVQENEAKYRNFHSHMINYAEEVGFLRGSAFEAHVLDQRFKDLSSSSRILELQQLIANSLDGYCVRYLGILAALGMMVPALSRQGAAAAGAGLVEDPVEYFLTTLHLLVNLMSAFKDIAGAFRARGTAKGIAVNVEKVIDTLKKDPSSLESSKFVISPIANETDEIRLENCEIVIPRTQETLIQPFSFTLKQGESLFVKGTNGAGKSSLFRVCAGLWPVHGERAKVSMPHPSKVMFLPQRSYILEGVTLREQILYPSRLGIDPIAITDRDIVAALKLVGFVEMDIHTLDSTEWCIGLSQGEQQRLACARVILRKPKFVFLDECTSSCTEEFEEFFFKTLKQMKIGMITISHRPSVEKFHEKVLSIAPSSVEGAGAIASIV